LQARTTVFFIRNVGISALVLAILNASIVKPAGSQQVGDIAIEQPWARATAGPMPNGTAYLTLFNRGKTLDRLIAAATPAAKRVRFHTHLMDSGIMKMRPVSTIELASNSSTVLQPSGLHIMLFGLKRPLKKGDSFQLNLTFERAGQIALNVNVRGVGSNGPTGKPHTQ
jgi:copper(I)-binding protein